MILCCCFPRPLQDACLERRKEGREGGRKGGKKATSAYMIKHTHSSVHLLGSHSKPRASQEEHKGDIHLIGLVQLGGLFKTVCLRVTPKPMRGEALGLEKGKEKTEKGREG